MASSQLLIRISFTALFAALTALGAFIIIPVGPVPIVVQNLFALLSGLILGPFMGSISVSLYLLAGVLNFPVFSGGGGGIVRFAGPTGGYLIGYLMAALTAGLIAGRPGNETNKHRSSTECHREEDQLRSIRLIIAVAAGLLVVYIPGLIWLKISQHLSWQKTFLAGCIPFVFGDIIKGITAVLIAPRLRRIAAGYLEA